MKHQCNSYDGREDFGVSIGCGLSKTRDNHLHDESCALSDGGLTIVSTLFATTARRAYVKKNPLPRWGEKLQEISSLLRTPRVPCKARGRILLLVVRDFFNMAHL